MSTPIMVHYEKGQFLLKCPFWANDVVKSLPAVRYSRPKSCWVAPLTRHNVKAMVEQKNSMQFTQEAQDAIHQHQVSSAERTNSPTGFPKHYVFKTNPLKHQRHALDRYYPRTEFAAFMDMGTGKSKLAIDFNAALRTEGKIDAWLIVCKVSLRYNWLVELEKHCPIVYEPYLVDTSNPKGFDKWVNGAREFPVLIVGIESLSQGGANEFAQKFVKSHLKVAMTLDESSLIANHRAIRSERIAQLGRQCAYRQALTGTPVAEGPMNLYMQFEYLDPDIIGIGDFYAFRNRYAVMGGYRDPKTNKPMEIVGYQHIDELIDTIRPWTYQVRKEEVLDLPPKVYQVRMVQATKEQKDLIKIIKKDAGYQVEDREVVLKHVLEKMMRLHQVSGGWIGERYEMENGRKDTRLHRVVEPDANPKLAELGAILDEARGKQAIIWCAYRHEISDVVAFLLGRGMGAEEIGQLHGGIEEKDRQRTNDDFQSGRVQIIVGNAATGGMGFTLTAAELVVYYSNTQKLVDRLQSEDRAHRHGQTRSVLYVDIVVEKTVDATFLKALKDKKDVSDYVRDKLGDLDSLMGGG